MADFMVKIRALLHFLFIKIFNLDTEVFYNVTKKFFILKKYIERGRKSIVKEAERPNEYPLLFEFLFSIVDWIPAYSVPD